MSVLSLRLATGAGALITIVAALLVLTGALSARGGNSDIEIPGIPEEQFEALGAKLLQPHEEPRIPADAAAATAVEGQPGSSVQSTTLVRLVNDDAQPRLDALAWAVSLDPMTVRGVNLGGPYIPDDMRTPTPSPTPPNCGPRLSYDVVFINAVTGDFIFEVQRSGDYQSLAPGETCPPTPVWTPVPVTPSPSP